MNLIPVEWKDENNVPMIAKELELQKGKMLETIANTLIGSQNPTLEQVMMLAGAAKSMGLNIFEPGMIYLVERNGKSAIQVGRQAFRRWKLAHPLYAGEDTPQYHVVEGQLKSCKFTVYRWLTVNGEVLRDKEGNPIKQGYDGIADWDSYCPMYKSGPSPTWTKFPKLMLSKCAEVQAIRAAFADTVAAVYISEEMQQDMPVQNTPAIVIKPPVKVVETTPTTVTPLEPEPPAQTASDLESIPQVDPVELFIAQLRTTRKAIWMGGERKVARLNATTASLEFDGALHQVPYTLLMEEKEAEKITAEWEQNDKCPLCGEMKTMGVCANGC